MEIVFIGNDLSRFHAHQNPVTPNAFQFDNRPNIRDIIWIQPCPLSKRNNQLLRQIVIFAQSPSQRRSATTSQPRYSNISNLRSHPLAGMKRKHSISIPTRRNIWRSIMWATLQHATITNRPSLTPTRPRFWTSLRHIVPLQLNVTTCFLHLKHSLFRIPIYPSGTTDTHS